MVSGITPCAQECKWTDYFGEPPKLPHVLRDTGPQGPRDRGLLGTAAPPTGALHGTIGTDCHSILGHGLGPTEDPAQGIEQCVDRTIADGFLPDLHGLAQGGKDTVPPHILASGPQTGTPRGHRRLLVHGALLSQGDTSSR